jgi:hypothetical protein
MCRIAPITLDLPPEEAFEIVRKAAQNRGWQIVEAVKPGGRVGSGASTRSTAASCSSCPTTSPCACAPASTATRIDIRSASRFGRHDLGTNAQRIRAFLEEVSNLAIAAG